MLSLSSLLLLLLLLLKRLNSKSIVGKAGAVSIADALRAEMCGCASLVLLYRTKIGQEVSTAGVSEHGCQEIFMYSK